MEIFGLEISRKKTAANQADQPDPAVTPTTPSFAVKQDDDGASIVAGAGAFGQYVDVSGNIQADTELITRYRTMADHPALNIAIASIVNEAIINEPESETVELDLSKVNGIPEGSKKAIQQEFTNILKLLDFNMMGYEIFKRWYIDGRLYYHAMIDSKSPGNGVVEFRYLDPRKIRKIREIKTNPQVGKRTSITGQADQISTVAEFYMYSEKGFSKDDLSPTPLVGTTNNTLKIAKDSIVHITSGQMDPSGRSVISYIHKAIRPLNQLTMLQDSMVINRVARGPERRIFYVDVSGLNKQKADQYMKQTMNTFKNKVVYDSATGEIRDSRKQMTMFEDFWLARRDGGKGTEVVPFPGASNLDQIADVEFAQKSLYQSLEIPVSRFDAGSTFSLGRATEISREEVAFEKFVTRLRARFSLLFLGALRLQLLLKNIMSEEDWNAIKNDIQFLYAKDNLFAELKNNEVLNGRLALLVQIMPFVGGYWSNDWVRRNICHQTDEEMEAIAKEIKKEAKNPTYQLMAQKFSPSPEQPEDTSGDLTDGDGQGQLPPPQKALPAPNS